MRTITDELFNKVLVLVTFAVYEHVQDNGTDGKPVKADAGWEDAYQIMEELEEAIR